MINGEKIMMDDGHVVLALLHGRVLQMLSIDLRVAVFMNACGERVSRRPRRF